jgi:hypothetical protein
MRSGLVMAAVLAGALGASAFAADSGLKPGTPTTPFQVVDVSGPNKGKQLCYR